MTPTILFWVKIGLVLAALWTLWNIITAFRKQQRFIPATAREWKRLLPDLLFFVGLLFAFYWIDKNFQRQLDTVINAKDKTLTGLYFTNMQTGQLDSLPAYKGKIVILNIWATWCGPCRAELPELEQLQARYPDQITILALSDESTATIQNFITKKPFQLSMGSYQPHPLLDSLNSRPVSILIGKNNEVKDVVVGARGYAFFKKWMQRLQ